MVFSLSKCRSSTSSSSAVWAFLSVHMRSEKYASFTQLHAAIFLAHDASQRLKSGEVIQRHRYAHFHAIWSRISICTVSEHNFSSLSPPYCWHRIQCSGVLISRVLTRVLEIQDGYLLQTTETFLQLLKASFPRAETHSNLVILLTVQRDYGETLLY